MEGVIDLEQLKFHISQTSAEAGLENCVWADHFAVQCIADYLSVSFLIFNEQVDISTTAIHPMTPRSEREFVILYLTNRNHYNLIGWQNSSSLVQYYFLYNQLPDYIRTAFELEDGEKFRLQNQLVADPDYYDTLHDTSVWSMLPDELLEGFFREYFNEYERKFCLANVCDRWGRIIWGHFAFPPMFISKKRKGKSNPGEKEQERPRAVLKRIAKHVPHLYSLIHSVEISYFQRGWMEDILELHKLQEFHFNYGTLRKFHLPNPDLKILVKAKRKKLEVLRIQPQAEEALPIKFNKCGYNAILNNTTRLKELKIDISSDSNNVLINGLLNGKLSELEQISLYGSEVRF